MISNIDELVSIIQKLMGASYNTVSDEGFEQACRQALAELEWSLPCTDSKKGYWITERARRHVIYVLLVESAHKFRFKEIHLHNRFKHYHALIQMMDDQIANAIEDNPELFDIGTYSDIFFYITNGFEYDYNRNSLEYGRWY